MKSNWRKRFWTFTVILAIVFVGMSQREAAALAKGEAEAFYKGATLRIIVPSIRGAFLTCWPGKQHPILRSTAGQR
jgi:hypothetical protein